MDTLLSGPRKVVEYTMSFINGLASECRGRTYLLQKPNLVEQLVKILKHEKNDSNLRQSVLGTLQKLSLRRQPQSIMIQLDMIQWISQVLKEESEHLSDYSVEYATALLMNLSLRSSGKDKCEEPSIQLLQVLNELVEHENLQVRTYVNGTLYSIFTRKKLREQAKELGMPEVLQYLLHQVDDQFKRQIQYILEQLNQQNSPGTDADQQDSQSYVGGADEKDNEDEEDDDDEDSEEDDEADLNDTITEKGIMIGEEWLINEFTLA